MNPCGRVVDVLRSCYAGKMSFYRDDPAQLTPIEWYFVPPSNGVVPFEHLFGSHIFDREDLLPDELGEKRHPHPYRNGLPSSLVSAGGLCGTREQWAIGALTTDPPRSTWPSTNIPRCCGIPGPHFVGGVGVGLVTRFCPAAWQTLRGPMAPVSLNVFTDWGNFSCTLDVVQACTVGREYRGSFVATAGPLIGQTIYVFVFAAGCNTCLDNDDPTLGCLGVSMSNYIQISGWAGCDSAQPLRYVGGDVPTWYRASVIPDQSFPPVPAQVTNVWVSFP